MSDFSRAAHPIQLATVVLILILAACATPVAPPPTAAPPTAVARPAITASATPPPTGVPTPIVAPPVDAPATRSTPPAPPPTATPDLIYPYTIAGLRARAYPGGDISTGELLEEIDGFRRYRFTYPSDGLTISGQMHVPDGPGPFPVLILLHGYVTREQYWTGLDTWQAAEFFARNGYLALAPDLRSWGASDSGASLFHTGLAADVMNLISAVATLPQADAGRIFLWGHSMGGGVATKVLAVDERVRAAVLYAPNSADDADLIARWGAGCLPGHSLEAGDRCNPAEVLPPDLAPALREAYFAAAADPQALRRIAPLYHLAEIDAPVQIHIGTGDGAELAQTPPEWSEKLAEALAAEGKAVAYFTYPGQGHFFQGGAWEQLLARALALFDGA